MAAGLAESLTVIHAAGVVHRDLKPSNVLLAQDGPHVIDFGISRAAHDIAHTHASHVLAHAHAGHVFAGHVGEHSLVPVGKRVTVAPRGGL